MLLDINAIDLVSKNTINTNYQMKFILSVKIDNQILNLIMSKNIYRVKTNASRYYLYMIKIYILTSRGQNQTSNMWDPHPEGNSKCHRKKISYEESTGSSCFNLSKQILKQEAYINWQKDFSDFGQAHNIHVACKYETNWLKIVFIHT